jgi:hypothetical protein
VNANKNKLYTKFPQEIELIDELLEKADQYDVLLQKRNDFYVTPQKLNLVTKHTDNVLKEISALCNKLTN